MGLQSPTNYAKARQMLGLTRNSSMDATTGFHAVLTFRPLCSNISLFGFDGNFTYDGHQLVNHAIDLEHTLLRQMAVPVGKNEVAELDLASVALIAPLIVFGFDLAM